MLMTVLPNGNANQSQAAGAAVLFHVRFDIMPAEGRLQFCLWPDFLIRQKHFFGIFNFHVNIGGFGRGYLYAFCRPRIIWGLARFLSVEKQIFRKIREEDVNIAAPNLWGPKAVKWRESSDTPEKECWHYSLAHESWL